ncbi:MAG: hypothetical protein LBS19_15205 [Clostridiales bacterium]|nr:hypothetical protein [Clostridiales bacterium]
MAVIYNTQLHSVCDPGKVSDRESAAMTATAGAKSVDPTGILVRPAPRPTAGDNDTSVLNAYRHWTARYKNGESADLCVTERRQAGVMTP